MSLSTYVKGTLVRVTSAFTDLAGTPVDPGSLVLKYRAPGAAPTSVAGGSLTKDSTGVYHYDIDTSTGAPGIWRYRWEATGNAQSAAESQFTVIASALN